MSIYSLLILFVDIFMSKPLKVYCCRDCVERMPLYYKKDQHCRDDDWQFCFPVRVGIFFQKEVWDYKREQATKNAYTLEQKNSVLKSAKLWGNFQCGVSEDW